MALQTKTITANGSKGHHEFTLTVTENSTRTANNTSSVSWSLVLSPITKGYDWTSKSGKVKYSVVFNGTTYSGAITTYDGKSTVTVKSGTATCTHKDDGTKTISFSFSITDTTGWSFAPGAASASGSMDLTAIPRKATITSAPNFTDVANPVLRYSNPAGNAVTSLKACISLTGSTDDIAYRDIPKTGTSYTFSLTEAERNVLRNATTGNSRTVYFYLWTVIGGVDYRVNKAVTFSISNGEPIITASVEDINERTILLTGDKNKLVKYFSDAQATMTAEAQKGASIDESLYVIRNGNQTVFGTSFTFHNVEDKIFTFSAEDSRGNVGTIPLTTEMVEYIKPTCNLYNNRPDALGNMTVACFGNYFNGSFGASSNFLTVQYRYKVLGGSNSSWTNMTVTKNGNRYYATADFVIPDFDQRLYYVFEARAVDRLTSSPIADATVKSTPIFHWGENDFVFEVPVTFNAGTTGASNVDIEYGSWTPTLNSSAAVSSYAVRSGWYQKIGNVVTIGWQINANINPGYDSTALSISGAPYPSPIYGFGGGVAYNIKVAGGFNFEGWGISTSGVISARLQLCNNTSAGNLNISSTSYYPTGGGSMTLSGTICYQTT